MTARQRDPMGARMAPEPDAHAYYVLGVLFGVLTFSLIDRSILSILLESIKQDLQVSDTAMGFLTGLAFALFNAIAGISLARLADRDSRRTIIALGLAAWSILTAVQGAARAFGLLALARVGVGVGEATTGPSAHSLISDYFRPERRATAIAVYTLGGHLGVLLGLALGGWLNDLLAGSLGDEAVRYSLFVLVPTNLWGAAHGFLGARSLPRDLANAAARDT